MNYRLCNQPWFILMLAAFACSASRAAWAQEEPSAANKLEVIRLQHVPADNVVRTLTELLGDKQPRISADVVSNSLLLSGPPELIDSAKRIIQELDIPLRQLGGDVRIYNLQHIEATQVLHMLTALESGYHAAVDERGNRLLVRASEAQHQGLDSLIQAIDVASPSAEEEARLRIVWLVADLPREDAPPPPEDLAEVVGALKKHGVDNLKLAAQMIVNVSGKPNSSFRAEGTTDLATDRGFMCELQIDGEVLSNEGGNLRVDVGIQARQRIPQAFGKNPTLGVLKSRLSLPPGHAVVLGVTPVESMTSVFVVQALEPPSKK